jgi:phenylacetate-CoA ligase
LGRRGAVVAPGADELGRVDLSVIAPCFNEEANVSPLVSRLLAVFERRKIAGEIVLVNDSSTDATGRLIDDLASRHSAVVAIHHPDNRGLSAAWDTGLAAARGTYVCFIDADLQNPPEEVWRLYREVTQSHADLVQGVRSPIGRLKDGRYLTSRTLNIILNVAFGMSARDNKSGFVIALRDTMADILRRRFRYRHGHVFILVAAHAKGFAIREVETLFQSRNAGESFIKPWPVRLIARLCLEIVKAFVEFRLGQKPVDGLDQFVRTAEPVRLPPRDGAWRRLLLEAYFLTLVLQKPLITRRARLVYRAIMNTQWAPPARIRELQELRLRRMMRHAYHHVPYYRDVFGRLRVRPEEIQTLSDLRRLPLLSRKDVSENLYFDLFADNHRKREMVKVTSEGSGADLLVLYVDRMQLEMRLATTLRALGWMGWRFGDRQARLWRQPSDGTRRQKIWQGIEAVLMRRLSIPSDEVWEGNTEDAMERIRRYRPVLVDGSAESLSQFVYHMEGHGTPGFRPGAIASSVEILPDKVRRIAERPFGANVFDRYCTLEFSGIADECEAHSGYHVAAESYIVEVLKDGRPVSPGERGEVVITDLNSFSVPLIRYRTGDLAVAMDDTPCRCRRGLPRIGQIEKRASVAVTTS